VAVVPEEVRREPEAFHRLLAAEGVTVLNQTPSSFRQLIRADLIGTGNGGAPGGLALRWVVFGGEALEYASLGPWFARHGDRRPRLVNMYGITETTVHVTYRPVSAADVERAPGSVIGAPIPDLQLYVLDRHMEPAPIGVVGQLWVGGAGLARGYLGRRGLTAERFVPDPFGGVPGARLYRTGDLARWLSVRDLEYLGRIDHQVQLRGFRVELGEIETALASHPAVAEAVVLALEEARVGAADGGRGSRDGGDLSLVAYLVAAPEAGADAADEAPAESGGQGAPGEPTSRLAPQ
jgi:non-ribosomal peptide synthetase component F